MADRIQPRTLKGFRDFLPQLAMERERILEAAQAVFRRFGYTPIDTPALEYSEILAGKGGDESDKQMYRFEDHGGRDVALRFDLTVPFARFAAQHVGQLGTPFRRYHIGPVWRGENPQRGRYREFYQCDFDVIGTDGVAADIETAGLIAALMDEIGIEGFTIKINDRRVLRGLLERLDLADQSTAVLRALDKIAKVGRERVEAELVDAGVDPDEVRAILDFAAIEGDNDEVLDGGADAVAGSETGEKGVASLRSVVAGCVALGVDEERLAVDLSIARGLDYYTGTVFETFLDDLPGIGSVCSGGRYDDLASLYTSQRLPGVGASLGVDRLLAAMEELGKIEDRQTPADALLVLFDEARLESHLELLGELRSAGLDVELYPEAKKLGTQLKYADRRGHRVAIIVGDDEWDDGTVQVKDLATGHAITVPRSDAAPATNAVLTR